MIPTSGLDLIVIPKNSGLNRCKKYAENLIKDPSKMLEVRGEDVPLFVESLIKEGKKVCGITGEDLFNEFKLENPKSNINILNLIPWDDSSSKFGKPTLCLLGPKNKNLEDLPERLRICISNKYKGTAEEYLKKLKDKIFERVYVNGSTEATFSSNLSDLVIDIVYSGKSAEEVGLEVYDKIFESDIVIIGQSKFDLEDLYKKIQNKICSTEINSYTKQLIADPELLKRKLIEEAAEVITAKDKDNLIWEAADLIYFLFVILVREGITIADIEKENQRRDKK